MSATGAATREPVKVEGSKLGRGLGLTLATLRAEIVTAGGVPDFDAEAVAALNVQLKAVTLSVEDQPYASWVIRGPAYTSFRRPLTIIIPMCNCGLLYQSGTSEMAYYAPLRGDNGKVNCRCVNPFGKPKYHREVTCHGWHGEGALALALKADRTYPKRRRTRS